MSSRCKWLAFRILAMIVAACPLVRAAEVTSHIPADSLGFVVVRDMTTTNAKLQNLIRLFGAPLPAPLDLFKMQTGFGEGFNESGDLAVALLPPQDEFGAPGPLALVPVTDYAAFVKPFNGDASGEICPVTVSDEEVLVAKAGDYALFMNPEYREAMQRIVAAQPAALESVAALGDWIGGNDGTIVLLPAGAKMLVTLATQEMANAREQMKQSFEDLGQQEEFEALSAMMDIYSKMLALLGDEVTSAALGVAIDDAGNIQLGVRAIATPDGKVAQVGQIEASRAPTDAIAEGPFVIAGGGPWPKGLSEGMMGFSLDLMKSMPGVYGLQDATEEDFQKLVEAFNKTMEGLQHMSFVLRPGEQDEPIYSNFYAVFHVDDAQKYFQDYRASMQVWNEIAAKATGERQFDYEVTEETIAQKPGIQITMDLTAAMGAQAEPLAQQMMQKMFGPDGKMRFYVVHVDPTRVLVSYSAKAAVEKQVTSLGDGSAPLASDANVATTAKLLPSDAPMVAYISPQGCVAWFSRMMNVMMGAFGGGGPVIPEYPATPPVGIAIALKGRVIETDVVFPAEMLQGLSKYIQEVQ
jgi:hypothetical protein